MKADAKTETAVIAVVDRFNETYARRDIDGLLALFAPDSDLVLFGTGADEKRIGLAELKFQAERDWAQSDSISFELGWHSVSAAGSVAWLAAEGMGQAKFDGQEMSFPFRFTAVLEHRGDKWLFTQGHLSVPAPGQAEGESIPT
jgi:ketosteroid isomerase-like protein